MKVKLRVQKIIVVDSERIGRETIRIAQERGISPHQVIRDQVEHKAEEQGVKEQEEQNVKLEGFKEQEGGT